MRYILILFILIAFSCKETSPIVDSNGKRFELIPVSQSGLDFNNKITESKDIHVGMYEYMYNGGGVAIGDFNNDGLNDIFLTGNMVPNKLYINKGDLKFEDVSTKAGIQNETWSTGVTLVDINADGWLDVYVCNSGPYVDERIKTNQLFINNGDLSFTERAAEYGIDDSNKSTMASFFDYDKDGDLDLFVLNHSPLLHETSGSYFEKIEKLSQDELRLHSNKLYRNNGNGRFTDVSLESGIMKPNFGLGVVTTDLNDDGYVDIYVANDFFIPDFMFINNGKGGFVDQIREKTGHVPFFSMGCDAADFNNDGLVDLATLDMTPEDHYRSKMLMASMNVNEFRYLSGNKGFQSQYMRNALQLNHGFGVFSDIASLSGVATTDWSWAALFADLDNDSWKDLVVTNGFKRDTKNNDWAAQVKEIRDKNDGYIHHDDYWRLLQNADSNPVQNYIFHNQRDLTFKNVASDWGAGEEMFSNGMATADLDNDGDLEMIVNNIDSEVSLYKNYTSEIENSGYLRVKLQINGSIDKALNSKVKITYEGNQQVGEASYVRGFQSTVEPVIHFGLGNHTQIEELEVLWNDGTVSLLKNPVINQTLVLEKQKLTTQAKSAPVLSPPFQDITRMQSSVSFRHEENAFDDFAFEILLPHQYSTMGPFLSVGDVNGDQLDDFFVGGAKGQPGALHVQNEKGIFSVIKNPAFDRDKNYEDLGSVFFDIDRDGDLDLYVASGGGGEFRQGTRELMDRLYLNNGRGVFSRSDRAIPVINTSSGRVKAADFDGDGWVDLFVCGRNEPGKYPYPGQSYLLKNNNGKLEDITKDYIPSASNLGMITDANWVDINGDQKLDLLVVGEWTGIHVFSNRGEKFEDISASLGLDKYVGWWQSLSSGDFDNDGDVDLLIGNIGKNNKFGPTDYKPLHVYCNDFDENGSLDIVLSKAYKNKLVPVRGKECSTEQMPFLAQKFPSYDAFSSSSLEQIYSREKLESALHYEANMFEHVYAENKGDRFEIKPLPNEAQIAPIMGMISKDFDKDGLTDAIAIGNLYKTEVETPRYDAGKGMFLQNEGNGEFKTSVKLEDNGIFVPGDAKDIQYIELGRNKLGGFIVSNNESILQFFIYRNRQNQ